ncbi:MAG: hypothetical protein AABZ74_16750 [Cyanobacteriota bacterium]
MPYLIVLNSSSNNINNCIDSFMKLYSGNSYILTEKKVNNIDSCNSIKESVKNWPLWYAPKWLLVGKKNTLVDKIPSFIFLEENLDIDYDNKNNFLSKNFDWAFFSYFSTYSERFISFVTEDKKIYLSLKKIMSKYNDIMTLDYFDKNTSFNNLKISVFNDYGKEGLLALEISKNENKLPYLICEITENYNESNKNNWYEIFTNKLLLIKSLTKEISHTKSKILIYQVTDSNSYENIWKKASSENNIALCTISGNSNLKEVEKIFLNKYSLSIKDNLDLLEHTDWIYTLNYGGGADEHIGLFFSSIDSNINIFWENLKNQEDILGIVKF